MSNQDKQVTQKEPRAPGQMERTRSRPVFAPDVDIKETDEELVLYADMPGVPEDKVDVTVENGILTLRGTVPESGERPGRSVLLEEYGTGDYERVFSLSDEVDQEKIRASVKNGVLALHLPKAGPAKARKIEVTSD